MNLALPSIEEIYNQYHRETFFAMKSFYPKSIKNFDKVLTNDKIELLKAFQNFIKRNNELVDWRIYIKACAQYFKRKFDLKILGSLNGNKIYRTYINYNKMSFEKSQSEICDEIMNSLKFIVNYSKENGIKVSEYLKNRDEITPKILSHLYSGTVSFYFYACLNSSIIFKIFGDIPDDIYQELFRCSRNDFIRYQIDARREKILCMSNVFNIINKIEDSLKNAI